MQSASGQWREHGFDIDFSELVFLGDRAEVADYLQGAGWRTTATPTNDLLVKYGMAPSMTTRASPRSATSPPSGRTIDGTQRE